jgi:hypothetical protein
VSNIDQQPAVRSGILIPSPSGFSAAIGVPHA